MEAHVNDKRVPAELVGCTRLGSSMTVPRSAVIEGRLRVQLGNGYEHFDLDHYLERDGASVPVFVWTDRTGIAE